MCSWRTSWSFDAEPRQRPEHRNGWRKRWREMAQALDFFRRSPGLLGSVTLLSLAVQLPSARVLVESDAPVLAPQPWRGRQNEPAYVTVTAETLAEVRANIKEAFAGVFEAMQDESSAEPGTGVDRQGSAPVHSRLRRARARED